VWPLLLLEEPLDGVVADAALKHQHIGGGQALCG